MQLGGDVTQRRGARGGLLERAQRVGGVTGEQRAGISPPKTRSPCASPARNPAASISAVSSGKVNRRGVVPGAGAPLTSSARASAKRPAKARWSTAATTLDASTLTVADGLSTRAMELIASAGDSTYSSTLWQMIRSAAATPATPSRLAASPCTEVRRAPASAARRCAAASASGLGSTTVTLCPRAANGTASPPVPPPTSTMSSACLPVSATRAETTARSTSQIIPPRGGAGGILSSLASGVRAPSRR